MSISLATLVLLLAMDGGVASSPPEALACLARHYAVRPVFENGAWQAALPGGARVPFDDGRAKTLPERLASPDVEDIFQQPYRKGPIVPVTTVDDDPGRVRVEAILAATYGGERAAAQQVTASFLGLRVRIHRAIVPALAAVERRLEAARRRDPALAPFLRRLSGGFSARKIAGTDRTSAHAFGIAIDLDSSLGDYWRWQRGLPLRWRNRIPQAVVDAFEAEGFIWGGRWYHYDTMHFEYRPELLGPPCREPLNASAGSQSR